MERPPCIERGGGELGRIFGFGRGGGGLDGRPGDIGRFGCIGLLGGGLNGRLG